jgi:hypothetical protein
MGSGAEIAGVSQQNSKSKTPGPKGLVDIGSNPKHQSYLV